jgi:5'-nucleotidase
MAAEPLRVLVTNDDGIDSPGLWRLAEAMAEVGSVMVVAPAQEASGTGTAMTFRQELQVREVESRLQGVHAYAVDGTPADCVVVGLRRLKEGRIGLVASGINLGPNLGNDVLLSGTVGAALQGGFRGITSLAFSLDIGDGPQWDTVEAVARLLGHRIADGTLPTGAFLNVNVPALPLGELQGIAVTTVARGGYLRLIETGDGLRERLRREFRRDLTHGHPGTDIWAIANGYVSISPLQASLGSQDHMEELRGSAPSLFAELRGGA